MWDSESSSSTENQFTSKITTQIISSGSPELPCEFRVTKRGCTACPSMALPSQRPTTTSSSASPAETARWAHRDPRDVALNLKKKLKAQKPSVALWLILMHHVSAEPPAVSQSNGLGGRVAPGSDGTQQHSSAAGTPVGFVEKETKTV